MLLMIHDSSSIVGRMRPSDASVSDVCCAVIQMPACSASCVSLHSFLAGRRVVGRQTCWLCRDSRNRPIRLSPEISTLPTLCFTQTGPREGGHSSNCADRDQQFDNAKTGPCAGCPQEQGKHQCESRTSSSPFGCGVGSGKPRGV